MRALYRSPAHRDEVRRWCADRLGSWEVAHTTFTVHTRLGGTHLTEAGTGSTTCVYLPGTSFSTASSLRVLAAMAGRCRVVSADLVGQPGLSDPTRPAEEVDGYQGWLADLVAAVRARHPDTRVVVAGHSRGAAVALTADPAQVDGIALLSPAGLAAVRVSAVVLRATLPWLLRPTEVRSGRLLELMSGPGARVDPDLRTWLTLVATGTRTTGAPGPLPAGLVRRWHGRPVVTLVGSADCFFPPDRLAGPVRDLLGSEVGVVPGAGHLLVDDAPATVADALARIL